MIKKCDVLSQPFFKPVAMSMNDYKDKALNLFRTKIYEKTFSIDGIPVRVFMKEQGLQKCYEKFVIGHPKFHNNTHVPDKERVARIEWISDLLEKRSKCSNSIFCGGIIISKYMRNKNKMYVIFCPYTSYAVFFEDLTYKGYYLMMSAYIVTGRLALKEITDNAI